MGSFMKFDVKGLFYVDEYDYPCRKYLDITKKNIECSSPELMVIMMNPGSSTPKDGLDNGCTLTETIPDPTQFQIMNIMENTGINFSRILNLSDLRNPNSSKFYSMIKNNRKDTKHCIFDDSRKEDLDALFIKGLPTIFAWGVDSTLKTLADLAVKKLEIAKPLGVLKGGSQYYHARPHLKSEQEIWISTILKQMSIKDF